VILLAEASYTSKIKYNIDDLMSSLVACKTQAEQVDGVLANIGKRGNLNNFIKQFVAMDDAVKALRKELDSVKAGLGDKLNNGWMKSFDEMVEKMSQISELSKNVFAGLNSVNLKDKGATKELRSYAEQLNTILNNVGIDKQIDLELFDKKDIEAQYNELIQFAGELNGKLSVVFGEIDPSKLGESIKSAGGKVKDDIKTTGSEISAEVQAQIDELKKQKAAYQEILNIFNGKGKRLKTTKENDKIALVGLVEDYKKAKEELAELERTGKPGKEEALIKKIKAASMLKETRAYVFEHGSPAAAAYAAKKSAETSEDAEKFLEDIRTKQNATLDKMKSDCRQKIKEINAEISNLNNGKEANIKESTTTEEKKIASYDELNKKVKEYISLLSSNDENQNEDKMIELVDQVKELAQASKDAGAAIEQVFSDLDFGDISGDEALSKICEILNVEVPAAAEKSAEKVSGVTKSLQDLLNTSTTQEKDYSNGNGNAKESMTFFGADKVVGSFSGQDFQVGTDEIVSHLVSNLKENIVLSLHNHPDGMDAFTPSDINSFVKLFYDQGTRVNGIIADGVVKTIDFTGISKEMAIKIGQSFSDNLKESVSKTNGLVQYDDDAISLTDIAKSGIESGKLNYADVMQNIVDLVDASLNKAFTDNGLESTLKAYTMEQLPELSAYLAEIQKSGENSVAPIEKLKSLLATLNPSHTADWDKFKDIFSSFESGEIDATTAWDQSVTRIKEIEAQAAEAHKKTTDAINKENQAQEKLNQTEAAQPAGQSSQGQTAQLEKEKELMQEIAALKEKLSNIPTNPIDASELEAAQKQIQALEAEILRMEGSLDSWKSGYYDLQNSLDMSVDASQLENMTSNDIVDAYKAQIESLSSTVDELKAKLAEAKEQLSGFGQDTDFYSADNSQLSFWPMTDEEIANKEKLAAANEQVAESQNKINQAKQLEGQISFDDLSVVEEKQKGVDAAEQELATEQKQNEATQQQLELQQQITKEKQNQNSAAKEGVTTISPQVAASETFDGQVIEGTGAISSEADAANKAKEAFAAAAEQKQKFIDANIKVKESAEASATAIDKETQKARGASDAFSSATDKKNNFSSANKSVKNSTDEKISSGTRKSSDSDSAYKDSDTYKTLVDANKKLSSAFNKIDTEVFVDKNTELGKLKARYEELTKEIQELTKSEETLGKVSEEDMQRLSTATKQLMSDFEKYAQAKKEASKQKDSTYGADVLEKVQSQHTSLIDKVDSGGFSNASGIANKLQQYEQAYQRIIDLQKKLANIDITSDFGKKTAAEFDDAVKSFNNYGKEIENVIKKSEEAARKVSNNIHQAVSNGFDLNDEDSRRSELEAFARSFDGLDEKSIQFSDSYSKVVFTIKNGNGEIEKITASFNQAGTAIDASSKNLGKTANKFTSFFDGVKKKTGEIATYFTGANLVYKAVAQIRQGITYVKEIDAALTELKKVTDETDATYKKFLTTASQTAGQIGSTVKDFTNATADFARLGYNIEQASDLAKAASVYYNVGDDLANIGEASDSIISTMHGFGIEAENAMNIVDKFNEVGNNFAISSSGIGQALLRSASAMSEAGNTIDESIGLITAANSVVQNPESVGTAMKTLSLRIRGAKVELEDAGEDVDGMANSVSELQKKLLALTGGKVNIMLDEKTFKNTTEILREMSTVWDDMTDVNRAAALELLGGKRQANVLAAVIKNFDMVEDAIKTSADSAGSAMSENEKYMDSIQGHIDQFNNSIQTMWSNLIKSDYVKFFVDIGTAITTVIDKLGLLGTTITVILGKHVVKAMSSAWKAAKTATEAEYAQTEASAKAAAAKTAEAAANAAETATEKVDTQSTQENAEATAEKAAASDAAKKAKAAEAAANAADAATDKANDAEKEAGKYTWGGIKKGAGKLKSTITKFLGTTIGKIAVGAGIALLAVGIAKGIDSYYKKRQEELIQEAKDLSDNYKNAKTQADNNIKALSESGDKNTYKTLSDEFGVLAKGVDKYGNNISLTSDQYERYKSICEQIVSIQPSIADGYDSATKAIGNNASAIEELVKAQQDAAKTAALEYTSDKNLNKIRKGAVASYKKANSNLGESGQAVLSSLNNGFKGKYGTSQYNGTTQLSASAAKKIMIDAFGYDPEEVNKILQEYFDQGGNFSWNKWIKDYSDKLKENQNKISDLIGDSEKSLDFRNALKGYETAANEVKQIQNDFINALLQVPVSQDDYAKLGDSGKSFITEWIKNSDAFKIDSTTSKKQVLEMRRQIREMVSGLADNQEAQDILDSIFTIDTSNTNFDQYKKDINEWFDMLFDSLGITDKNEQKNIKIALGFDFDVEDKDGNTKQGQLVKDIARVTSDTEENIQQWLDSQPAAKVQAMMQVDWSAKSNMTKEQVADEVESAIPTSTVSLYSDVESSVSKFNEVLSQTEEIINDNTAVSDEYKSSLTSLGITQEELNECFDESNPLMVKNAALLRKLVIQKRADQQATVRMAKSYTRLQYKNTVKQLQQVVAAMAKEYKATGLVSTATQKSVDVLRSQLVALKQTQREYALLEIQLSGATNAYENFEKAKELDSKLTYGDSMIEMLNTINDGFKTGQVGTEAFQAAVRTLVPSSVYEDLDNFNDRMVAIHDYIDKNPLFADWFTIEDGEFSITQKNIQAFVKDAQAAGVFTQDDENGNFFLADGVESIDQFVDKINEGAEGAGVTKEAVVAMLTEFAKYDASWSDVLSDLTTNKFDKEINNQTKALEKASLAKAEYLKAGGGVDTDKWNELCKAEEDASKALDDATAKAAKNASQYSQLEAIYKATTGEMKITQEQADALAKSLGLVDANGNAIKLNVDDNGTIQLTTEQAELLNQKRKELTEPTIVTVQANFDNLSKQLDTAKKYLSGENLSEEEKTVLFDAGINVDKITPEQLQAKIDALPEDQKQVLLDAGLNFEGLSKEEIQEKIDEMPEDQKKVLLDAGIKVDAMSAEELTTACNDLIATVEPQLKSISLTYGITKTSEEQQDGTIEKLQNWESNGITFTVSANTEEAQGKVDALNTEKDKLNEPATTTYTVDGTGESSASKISNYWDNIPTTKTTTYTINERKVGSGSYSGQQSGINGVDGTAHATGSWGVQSSEHNALVGELGQETLVRNGKWKTIGDDGAEMINLKRGDIIFNHLQTEQLLKNGHITSRGRMVGGMSFAEGNAHYGLFDGYTGLDEIFKNGSNNWVDAWSGAASNISDAAGDISDASDSVEDAADDAKQTIDFIEYRLEEIENIITNATNRLENFLDDTSQAGDKNSLYEDLVNAEKQKASTYFSAAATYNKKAAQLLSEVPAEYQEMAKNGAIAIKDFVGENEGEIADAIEEYRTWSSKAEDAENNYLESIAEISAKRLEQLQDIADDFENIVGLTEQHSNLIQAEMDLLDEAGERLSENFYKELMKDSKKQIEDLNNKRASLQGILDNAVKSGDVQVGSDDWYEMVNAIFDVDDAILECKKDIEGFQNSINDLYWDNLDKLIDRIDNVDSELSHLYNLVSDEEKVVDDAGNWTKDGVTALGLLAQQLEVANFKVEQYGEAIARLEKDYAAGLYSTDEYNEKLAELKENQWGAIEAQESAKKSLIDLNKTRIQAVKDGMQKEIDAYSKLIDRKKEELNLQKESHDFSKQVAEQQKNIADIEKRLAVISGDNSASAIAQKKKLQAELAQAKEELEELYYDHSVEKQQDALDKQLEDYQNNKQNEMDALDESLKNEDQIIQDSYTTIAANTELLAQNLSDIADKYGITLSDSVTKPWLDGADAIGTYQGQLDTSMSAFTEQLKLLKQELIDLQVEADKTANSIINATNSKKDKTESARYTPPAPAQQPSPSPEPAPAIPEPPSKGSSVTVKSSATHFSRNGGNGTRMQSWVPGSTFTVYQVSGDEVLLGRNGGYTGWVKLSDIEGYYAQGTKKIPHDQMAIIDELGEELVLHAGNDGRLQYLSKGSSVIPHDITSNLMKLGSLDPTQVLERSTPSVNVPYVTNNNIELNMEFGSLVHVDAVSNDTMPELQKMVRSEFDNCMKSLNNSLKRFCR
jgi:DNA repair exonuclease SbcCD ATPase subunit